MNNLDSLVKICHCVFKLYWTYTHKEEKIELCFYGYTSAQGIDLSVKGFSPYFIDPDLPNEGFSKFCTTILYVFYFLCFFLLFVLSLLIQTIYLWYSIFFNLQI